MNRRATDAALVGAVKLLASGLLVAVGFEGVSDDDYARVVIAQNFAHAPSLDPSGTSWLPLPFWVHGASMMLFGTSLGVARAVGVVLGVLSSVLVWLAASWMMEALGPSAGSRAVSPSALARTGAILAAISPWSLRLGAAVVPELLSAACSLLAAASLVPSAERAGERRLAGAVALFVASLSRYEPWFVGAVFAGFVAMDGVSRRVRPWVSLVSAALVLSAPAWWLVHNQLAHGHALFFLDSVVAYKRALDGGEIVSRLVAYPLAVVTAEPEMTALLAFFAWRWLRGRSRENLARVRSLARPAMVLAVLVVLLTISSARGGAPTHHLERALLALTLFEAVLLGAVAHEVIAERRTGWPWVPLVALAAAVPGLYIWRAWYSFKESHAHRAGELAIGREVARVVPRDERVLLEAADYGYFAVEAGSGRPWCFVLSGEIDAAGTGRALAAAELVEAARAEGLRFAVGRAGAPDEQAPAGARVVAESPRFKLYEVTP
ncbi:MAG: hypothetical protein U0271_12560 [Polyangiaceae bacterium]